MATPTINVDSTGGSSDTTASGAGPGTAISGSTGRTRNTASQLHFGFFGATDDFSGVATDGSASLYTAISTLGQRNHGSIAGMKNTRHVDVGDITAAAAVLSNIASTSGWTAGDVLSVAGAGAAGATLYSTILTVDSATQVTLNDNAGTTVTGAVVENPKQATLTTSQGVNTGTTDTVWGIGGKRATIAGTNSKKLFDNNSAAGDAMPGWIVEMKSGHTETIAAALTLRRAGDTTDGSIQLRGISGAATRPILTFSNNGNGIAPNAVAYITLRDFGLQNSNATKTASVALVQSNTVGIKIINVKVSHSTNNFFNATTGMGAYAYFKDCEFGYCANMAVISANRSGNAFINCWVHHCTSHGIQLGTAVDDVIFGCVINNNGGRGIDIPASSTGGNRVIGNTIADNTGDGIRHATVAGGAFISNNILSGNGGYGINFSAASESDLRLLTNNTVVCGNAFYNNMSGDTNPSSLPLVNQGATSGSNPTYTNASGGDFSIGTNLKAKGYPLAGSLYVGTTSATYSYVDPGAAQRQEPSGGGNSVAAPFNELLLD